MLKNLLSGESNEYTPINIIAIEQVALRSGHYVAYVKDNGSWYLCDDATIAKIQGTSDNPIPQECKKISIQ